MYRDIAQPDNIPDGNLVYYAKPVGGNPPVATTVTPATVAAGQVNPAVAALAVMLHHTRPGVTFHIGDAAVQGTGRDTLMDDSNPARSFADMVSVVNAVEAGAGRPIDLLVECWYRSDTGRIADFRQNFWPFYFGANPDGTPFTLGTPGPTGAQVDHCLWDALAAPTDKGRGIFARATTDWTILTPMSDIASYPIEPAPEAAHFAATGTISSAPRRDNLHMLVENALAQSVRLTVGPSAHVMRFNNPGAPGGSTHPSVTNPDGQVGFMWAFAAALIRKAGIPLQEPTIHDIEVDAAGTWADVLVNLPNGGMLSTRRIANNRPVYSGAAPHRQQVVGFEISRGATIAPVFNTAETGRPAAFRGTVTITDTGSGSPRRGRVRITPVEPFVFGNALRYLAGGSGGVLLTPRDLGLDADLLIEHVPTLFDAEATYPFDGIAVRPAQSDMALSLTPPSFTARGAFFDGATRYSSNAVSLPTGNSGLLSLWFRNNDTAWNAASNMRIFQMRNGTSVNLELHTSTAGRLRLRINSGGSNTVNFDAPASENFVPDQWYHVLIGWTENGTVRAFVDGQQVANAAVGAIDYAVSNITRAALGAETTGGNPWNGSLAHVYLNLTETLDLTDPANLARFIAGSLPVDLGANGQLPTGNAPAWYYDGDAPEWINLGSAGNIPLTGGPLTAAPLPIQGMTT